MGSKEGGGESKEARHFIRRCAGGALEDPLAIVVEDEDADRDEPRFHLIGTDYLGRVVVVAYAHDNEDVRMISARPATAKERKQYED